MAASALFRHGADPERVIQAGIGPIEVRRQKVRDRATGVPAEARVRFASNILPKWARRTKSLDALLPVLYLRGISTGDFQEALSAILGADAPNLSPGVIAPTAGWQEEYDRWQGRDLFRRGATSTFGRMGSICRRGWNLKPSVSQDHRGTPRGQEGVARLPGRVRESAQSWRELRIDIKARGLTIAPEVAVGDGALGFWKAVDEVFPGNSPPALLVPQDLECSETSSQNPWPRRSPPICKTSTMPKQRGGPGGHHIFKEIWGQIRPRRDVPDQGRRGHADLLRLPGRALGSPAHLQPG